MTPLHRLASITAAVIAALAMARVARAGGTPESALLIIDPTDSASMQIGNYYKNARNIPDSNVLYLRASAANYTEFKAIPQRAFQDTLTQRGIAPKIDYVILAPLNIYSVPAPNQVDDGCFPVSRFSIASCFTISQISASLPLHSPSTLANQYFSESETANFFSSATGYLNGVASAGGSARRYYIGALLGYVLPFGNTVDELKAMIDRSVQVDGTRPGGTFYYMNTSNGPRNVRQPGFAAAISQITLRGGSALQLNGILPDNRTDVLGIMTGISTLDAASANMSIRPGAFCDHLTSFAGAFNGNGQTPMSVWIASGASGSAGTVDEPCNYLGKFPNPRLHQWYFQGMSLGEAYLRSMAYVPFQSQLYGDPLCRPWAYFPTVSVGAPPSDVPVSGVVSLVVNARATAPAAFIGSTELFVDGVSRAVQSSGTPTFTLDTRTLDDGWHDIRILSRDTTATRNVGRWTSSLLVRNHGRSVTLEAAPQEGDLSQAFAFTASTAGGTVTRFRLIQNGRTIAAGLGAEPLTVYGSNLGAGVTTVIGEATYADGRVARSAPVSVSVLDAAPGQGAAPPVAFDSRKYVTNATVYVVELPGAFSESPAGASFTLLNSPANATILNPTFTGGYRLIRPNVGASWSETIQYRVQTAGGVSNIGTVTLEYSAPRICTIDFNVDGEVNPDDLGDYINCYFSLPTCEGADFNADGDLNPDDLGDYLNAFFDPPC